MKSCLISLDNQFLYCDLPPDLVGDLLADIVTRYEGLFTFASPVYPDGKAALLFSVLREGYGLMPCSAGIDLDVIDLMKSDIKPASQPDDQWKDVFAGRVLARTFATTLSSP